MTREEFTFDSRDGKSRIYAVKWVPEESPRAVLQIIHGMAEPYERYEGFAEFLTKQGILVTADDYLGHGKTKNNNPGAKAGYFCKEHSDTVVVRDEHRLKKTVQGMYPGLPYFVLGHSMGSFIARNYICRYGSGIDGAVIMGTGMQPRALLNMSLAMAGIEGFFKGDDHVSRFIDKLAFSGYNKRIPDAEYACAWLSRDKEIQKYYTESPECGFIFTDNGFKTLFTLIRNLTDENYLQSMPKELPVLFNAGTEDPVGEYGAAVKRVYDSFVNLGMKDVSLKLYEGCRHEILNELNKEEVYSDILEWLNSHI